MAIIGITDSGKGGLTILSELYLFNKNHKFIYLADTLNSPYGLKSMREIFLYTKQCCDRLCDMGSDIIVLACNTATSAAIDYIRPLYDIEIIGTEPAVIPAIRDKHKRILVLATPYTINSNRYRQLSETYRDRLIDCPCRDLARMIDDAAPDYNSLYDYIDSILKPFKGVTAIILGCTHYVLIKKMIRRIMPHADIYDSAEGIANRVDYILNQNSLSDDTESEVIFLSTDDRGMDCYNRLFSDLISGNK